MSGFAKLSRILTAALVGLAMLPIAIRDGAGEAHAANVTGPSGLPLPRFVSLKSGRVNLRIGPGRNYAVEWMYLKSGLPMEIIQEYDTWRRVRDAEGTEGWVNQSLLSGKRTAIVAPWQRGKDVLVSLLEDASEESAPVASLEPGVVGRIELCNGDWCKLDFDGHRGWMKQALIWGAYPGELVED